jgi:hypothetical protein
MTGDTQLDRMYRSLMRRSTGMPKGVRAKRFYIRFGALPKGNSAVGDDYRHRIRVLTGHTVSEFEKGVSVYPTFFSPVLQRWFIAETHGGAATLSELYSEAVEGDREILLLTGRRVSGEGADGEPLLSRKSIKIIKRLKPAQIYSEVEGLHQLTEDFVRSFVSADEAKGMNEDYLFSVASQRIRDGIRNDEKIYGRD